MGIIISSFPGCGKNYLMNTHGSKAKMLDALTLMGEGQEGEYDQDHRQRDDGKKVLDQ